MGAEERQVCCVELFCLLTRAPRGDTDAAVDLEKLRKYERERLRYFYAVVDCDSASTAEALYQQCDGLVSRQLCRCEE